MYWNEEPYDEPECCGCTDKQDQLDNIKSFFLGVLENLYGVNKLNLENLEHCLDEIAHQIGMKLPEGKLQIRGVVPMNHMLEDWKQINNMYLKSLTTAGV